MAEPDVYMKGRNVLYTDRNCDVWPATVLQMSADGSLAALLIHDLHSSYRKLNVSQSEFKAGFQESVDKWQWPEIKGK